MSEENSQPPEVVEDDPPIEEVPVSSWEMWRKSPSPASMSAVIRSVEPVIKSSVRRYPGVSENLLRGEAKRLTVQAVKTFDPAQGTTLSTHVFNHLRPLARFSEKATKAISVPRDLKADVGKFVRARKDFEEENGREPSDGEIQDILGINSKRLGKLNAGSFFEMPEGQMEGAMDVIPEESARLNLHVDYVYHDLAPRDKLIMDYRMGRNGRPVKEANEIAQILKMDPSHVRKRANMISSRILEGLNDHDSTDHA